MLEPISKSIIHLQKYAWRFHKKDCINACCLGCGDDVPISQTTIKPYFHSKQMEFLSFDGREGWLITGRRFGKTEVGIFRVICKLLGYNPITNRMYKIPQRWWIVGLDYSMLRDEIIRTFKRLMPDINTKLNGDESVWDFRKADLIAKLFNNSEVIFKSCESGMSKFQSVGLDGIHYDEEPPKDIYNEGKLRIIAGKELEVRGSMTPNPIKGLTWTYHNILKNEERQKTGQLRVWTGSTYENKALSKSYLLEYEKELEEWERDVRLGGNYAVGLGRCAFNVDKLIAMREKSKPPIKVERLSGVDLKVWNLPNSGYNYIVSADPAEGLENGDNSACCVLCRNTMSVDASYTGKIDPDIFGKELVTLAKWYNNALIICESNNHGLTTIKSMEKLYSNIYSEKSKAKLEGVEESRRMGWYTNILTRPQLVDGISQAVREDSIIVYDSDIIDEMTTFIINTKGKAEAQHGCKDDRVMSLGLAIQGHLRTPMNIIYKEKPKPKRRQSCFDDPINYTHTNWMAV